MTRALVIVTHPLARRAWPWLPVFLGEGRIYVGPTGEFLRANADGTLDVVYQGGRPHGGIGEDPAPGRRA